MSRKPAKEPFVVQFSGSVEALHGGVAQLGEHLPCKQGVKGSIPFISTRGSREANSGTKAANENGLIAQVVRARA